MRTSTVLASILFGSFAAAAPVDKRALVYHTEVVYETIVVYTTVYDDDLPATSTAASTSEALFYEKPSSSVVVVPTSSAAPVVVKPSSVYTPTPAAQTPTPVPTTSTPAPTTAAAAPTTEAAKPTTTTTEPAYVAPTTTNEPAYVAPTTSSLAAVSTVAAVVASSDTTTTSGETYSDVDITIYDNVGGYGACGTKLYDTDMIVAIAQPAWGASTYDVQTGAATNPWCGQKVNISYGTASVTATIMDMCPGCAGHDLDLSVAAWNALGLTEKTRLKASWSKVS